VKKNQVSLFVILSFLFLTACSESGEFISAFERTVADNSSSGSVLDSEPESVEGKEDLPSGEVGEDSPRILLFDKVLANSDVSEVALTNAFEYYDDNHSDIDNKKWITIFDIGEHSGNRRMFIINMETGDVSSIHTSHGKKSDLDHDGIATSFSNTNGSNKSSLGFMLTAETYYGKHGLSLRLDGLESRNSRARARAIVVHGASYVDPSWSKMGRSLGCPAVSMANRDWVIGRIKEGSLFYIFHKDYDS